MFMILCTFLLATQWYYGHWANINAVPINQVIVMGSTLISCSILQVGHDLERKLIDIKWRIPNGPH
jgi:hypothetical protein